MGRLLAITPNFTIDHLISLDTLVPGEVHRSNSGTRIPGGKGVNVARVVRQLGHEAAIAGFLAGRNGQFAADQFAREGLEGHYIWYDGETRTSILIDEPNGRTTVINERGSPITSQHVAELSELVQKHHHDYEWISFSGSIPPGALSEAYKTIFEAARPAKIALDSHGEALSVLSHAKPDLLRINDSEAGVLLSTTIDTVDSAMSACLELVSWGIEMIAISLGASGTVGCCGSECWHVPAPAVKVISTVGAGDGMFGVMLAALMDGLEFREALRRGVAAGSACCTIRDVGKLPIETYEQLLKVTQC